MWQLAWRSVTAGHHESVSLHAVRWLAESIAAKMDWLKKGLLLLPCVSDGRLDRVRQQHDSPSTTPWHQQPDIVSLVLARLSTADVLSSERVCKAWRTTRVLLTSDIHLVTARKVSKWQHAWLTRNVDRIASRLALEEEGAVSVLS